MMLTFLSLLILAQAPQGWQENARMEDEVYYFYTGVSSPLENKRKAREEAVNQARSAFLIEHFGLHMKIDERVISNLNQQSVTQDLSIRTPEHFLVVKRFSLDFEDLFEVQRNPSRSKCIRLHPQALKHWDLCSGDNN